MSTPSMTEFDYTRHDDELLYLNQRVSQLRSEHSEAKKQGGIFLINATIKLLKAQQNLQVFVSKS